MHTHSGIVCQRGLRISEHRCGGLGEREVVLNEMEHVLNNLLGSHDVPDGEHALRPVANGGRKHRIVRDRKFNGAVLVRLLFAAGEERDGARRVERDTHARGSHSAATARGGRKRGAVLGEGEERAVARAEDELGVGMGVEDALEDLALVDGGRANLEVLLSDKDNTRVRAINAGKTYLP